MQEKDKATARQLLEPLEVLDANSLMDLGDGEEAEHSPIIITGGSSTIDLSSQEYSPVTGIYTSSGLYLHMVECLHAVHADQSPYCYFVRPGELCVIVFHCTKNAATEKRLIIQGGLEISPTIIFDLDEFPGHEELATERFVHSKADRKIDALEIFSIKGDVTKRVHVCPLIPANGQCAYKIWDPHPVI
jgi:hypothetical protein